MYPQKIQLSGLAPGIILLWALSAPPLFSAAQSCSGTLQSSTSSVVYYGTGNDTYTPNFSKYSPPPGYSLVAAVLKSFVTVNAKLDLNNTGTNPQSFKPGLLVNHIMQLDGDDLYDDDGDDISNITLNKTFPTVAMNPGDALTVGPVTAFNNSKVVKPDSITTASLALNSFIGSGNVDISYSTSTSYITNVSINPSVKDTVTIALTYYYCYTGPLASDILTFTANRKNDATVALSWLTSNEQGGRSYVVELSAGNGNNFSEIATRPADPLSSHASYAYSYAVRPFDKGKLYFRIRLVDVDGTVAYSPMRMVDLGAGQGSDVSWGFSIYPNPPTDFINVQFPPGSSMGWQVDILTADGRLIQRNSYRGLVAGRVNFIRRLVTGTYFARATDLQTGKSFAAAFLVK